MDAELVVVGSGPAGLSAAIEAAQRGVDVKVIDENHMAGGQLFKQIHKFFGSKNHRAGVRGIDIGTELLQECERLKVGIFLSTIAWGVFDGLSIGISDLNHSDSINAERIIFAAGGYEKTLLFPGWTLPGVIGAGAAQTMMNVHRVKPGNRVLMVGSGNVGLIVAYQMILAGIDVIGVVESTDNFTGWHVHAAKIMKESIPIYPSCTVSKAIGDDFVEEVELAAVDGNGSLIPGTETTLDADTICLAVGIRPRTRLLEMIHCQMKHLPELGGFCPIHDDNMETSVKNVFVAGDIAGCEEASTAMEEGKLAGLSVARSLGKIKDYEADKAKNEILSNLQDLRVGTFGDKRFEAKKALLGAKIQ